MTDPQPEAMHEHALSNLRYIREAMERAGAFTSIPGWGGFVIGLTAVATAVFAHGFLNDGRTWVTIWLAEAVLAVTIAAVTMWRKGVRVNLPLTSKAARRFFASYLSGLAAGALLTLVLARMGAYAALPALWLLVYGSSFVASGAFSIRVITVMGLCFMVLGIAACFLPLPAGNVLMGAGFGGLHIVFGLIIARSHGG